MAGSGSSNPQRITNTELNQYWGMLWKNTPQKSVFIHGQKNPPGLEGGFPTIVFAEFDSLQPFDTLDTNMNLPDDFTLLAFLAYAGPAGGNFKVELYDLNREILLTERALYFNLLAGQGKSPLYLQQPYAFQPLQAQCFVRMINAGSAAIDATVGLYGVLGGVKS